MAEHADNLLASGHNALEGLGRQARTFPDNFPEIQVKEQFPEEHDGFTVLVGSSAPAFMVADVDPNRDRMVIQHVSGQTVKLGKREDVTSGRGFTLLPGRELEITSGNSVWIAPDQPGQSLATVSVWVERNAG